MKQQLVFPLTFAAAFLLAACGDNIEKVTQINQMGMDIVADEDDLPECSDKNEGEQALVKGETSVRICVDGEWVAMKDDFSCNTVELKDKSGYKIVCNGDSIGVVLNGSDGKDGKEGKEGKQGEKGDNGASGSGCSITDRNDTAVVVSCGDSTMVIDLGISLPNDTAETDSERILTKLDSIVGLTQKGPFLKGSTVYLYELSDGRTLKQTNGNFTSNITSNNGRYRFSARDLVSQYAMVVVDGNYRNEVTGAPSKAPIRLKAITDMRKRNSVNVNLLTHMEFDRVYQLVTRGDKDGKKLTVKQAKRQAQKEILKQFYIELDDNADAEDMDVFGKTDADAALLAVSVLLQGDSNETALTVLLTEISNAIEEKGEWKDSITKARLADWALKADTEKRLAQFRKNVAGWHLGDTVPNFEKFVRNFVDTELGLGPCGDVLNPVGKFARVPNENSEYHAQGYNSNVPSTNDLIRLICDDIDGNHWRVATALERDTKGLGTTGWEEGDVQKGEVDPSLTYVFENGNWRHGTELDLVVGFGCTLAMADKDSIYKKSDQIWYKCSDTTVTVEGVDVKSAWHLMDAFEKDYIEWERYRYKYPGDLLEGRYTGKTMVWDDDTLREASDYEIQLRKACVTSMYGTKEHLSNTLTYTCDKSGWSKTGTFADERVWPYTTYKGVQIGGQVWMAENLNYRYTEKTKDLDSSSFCYNDDPANCDKYGRLYLWSAAMDSAGVDGSNTANGCGFVTTCTVKYPVRGICPEGWNLPDSTDWATLFDAVGGAETAATVLKSQTGWYMDGNGTDVFGFAGLPAGYRYVPGYRPENMDNPYYDEGLVVNFWSSSEGTDGSAYVMGLGYFRLNASISLSTKEGANPIRCVHNLWR